MKPLIMTASGTRGIIGENLFPDIATKIAIAYGLSYIKSGTVIVGGDTRVSYEIIKQAVI